MFRLLPAFLTLPVLLATLVVMTSAGLAQQPTLSTTTQVRERFSVGTTVRIRGVVTGHGRYVYYVQDDTGALAVLSQEASALPVGALVDVTGLTLGANASRALKERSRVVTGTAPLPDPEITTPEKLFNGGAFNQRAKVTGTIHDVTISNEVLLFQLETAGTPIVLSRILPKDSLFSKELADARSMLDAVVEATGVARVPVTPEGGPMPFWLLIASPDDVRVIQPGSADVFLRPLRTVQSLLKLEDNGASRVRVKGHVTFASEAGWFYLRDATGIAMVRTGDLWIRTPSGAAEHRLESPLPQAGDTLELTALPANHASPVAHLTKAMWRVLSHDDPPAFIPQSVSDIMEGGFDGMPVSLTGEVIDVTAVSQAPDRIRHTLTMRSEGTTFAAVLEKAALAPLTLHAGDYALLTGVTNTTSRTSTGRPLSFELHLASLNDIHAMAPPVVWHNSPLLRWLLGALFVAAAAVVWIVMLRRQVQAQTAQLQTRLEREVELSEMKSRFVFTVSHEFRNPLAVIMSCSDVLQRYREKLPLEQYNRQLDGIQNSVRRMADLMEEVLLLGRAEAGRLRCETEPTDLPVFCQRLVDQTNAATAGRCPIGMVSDELIEPARTDRSLLQHILTNLLTNAVKYSPAGSPVSLEIQRIDRNIQFRVSDLGHGIPARDQTHLFEPFHRGGNVGETPGTGLGLAIVKRCVVAHGGSIHCESHEDKGTIFTVLLPLVPATEPPLTHEDFDH